MKIILEKIQAWISSVTQAANDAIDDVIATVQYLISETKRRVQRIKEEVKDVVSATKEVGSQASDVVDAAKGKARRGRPAEKKEATKKK